LGFLSLSVGEQWCVPQPPVDHERLSLALSAWADQDIREGIELARRLGYRAVHLDAANPSMRPRELGRSARRDLGATLRRAELLCTGLDLWIPPAHFLDGSKADRAMAALLGAMELARDLASILADDRASLVSVTIGLDAAHGLSQEIERAAQSMGVRVADHSWPTKVTAPKDPGARAGLGIGLDPAAILISGGDPAGAALTGSVMAARLSDADGLGRCEPGASGGRLDLDGYLASLAVVMGDSAICVDLRRVPGAEQAASRVLERHIDARL